jgi:tetratricopeptide (TPR) repeat protein
MNLRLLILFLLTPAFLISQDILDGPTLRHKKEIDFLNSKVNDKTKIAFLDAKFWGVIFSEPDTASLYAQQTILLARNMDIVYQSNALNRYGYVLSVMGNYPLSIKYLLQSEKLAEKINDTNSMSDAYSALNETYRDAGDYKMAIYYSDKERPFWTSKNKVQMMEWMNHRGDIFEKFDHLDSALIYTMKSYQMDIAIYGKSIRSAIPMLLGNIYAKKGDTQRALDFYREAISMDTTEKINKDLMEIYDGMAKIFIITGKTDSAIFYSKQTLSIGKSSPFPLSILQACTLLSDIYQSMHYPDSALKYLKMNSSIKDTLFNQEKTRSIKNLEFEDERKQQEIDIAEIKFQNRVKIYGLVAILILFIILWHNSALKRKNETHLRELSENELKIQKIKSQNKFAELEMQALRSQMNPHFIFNSLNSINRFIMQNNRKQAAEYLTKFSRLVRLILQNSQTPLITLESELESLGLYLEMEALRFDYHFTYKISTTADLDISVLKVPPLIIQPYVENAIWHGLMHKEDKGQLDIEVSEEEDHLLIKITDNGIGRKQAAALASKSATKYKSQGLKITGERIAMLQSSIEKKSSVTLNDLENADGSAAGTEVIIKIPVIYD